MGVKYLVIVSLMILTLMSVSIDKWRKFSFRTRNKQRKNKSHSKIISFEKVTLNLLEKFYKKKTNKT